MTNQQRKFIIDILKAIKLIEDFISDTPDYESYISDPKTQSAVERQLGIIGEAVNKYNQLSDGNIDGSREIIGLEIESYMLTTPLIQQ